MTKNEDIEKILSEINKRLDGLVEQQQHIERTVSMFYHNHTKLKLEGLENRLDELENRLVHLEKVVL